VHGTLNQYCLVLFNVTVYQADTGSQRVPQNVTTQYSLCSKTSQNSICKMLNLSVSSYLVCGTYAFLMSWSCECGTLMHCQQPTDGRDSFHVAWDAAWTADLGQR